MTSIINFLKPAARESFKVVSLNRLMRPQMFLHSAVVVRWGTGQFVMAFHFFSFYVRIKFGETVR